MNKKIGCKINLMLALGVLFSLIISFSVTAQLGSLVVWENAAGGVLICSWTETTTANWAPGLVAGAGVYNCSTSAVNWTIPSGLFGDAGHRWYCTYEVKIDDANLGIGLIYAYHNQTSWDGWLYILEDRWDVNPGFYLVKNDAGTIKYRNATTWITNMSLASDYSGDAELDCYNGYCRVKSLYNGYNHSLMVKIWDPTGDEPTAWLYNSHATTIKATASNNMTCGLLAICGDGESDKASFRRMFFWNLSYDLYGATTKPEIVCPTYDAMSFYDLLIELSGEDLWNQTSLMQGFFNSWDLTSLYTNDMYVTGKTNQNDTTYVFSNMLTDFVDFWEWMYPDTPLPDEAPDNTLILNMYQTTDGTNYGEGDDYVLVRIDSDNNGVYNSYDYAVWCNGTGTDIFYQGWTPLVDTGEWYGVAGENWNEEGDYGEIFRDYGFHTWSLYLNWDLIYNGTSDERVGSDLCRMSIAFYDKNSTNLMIGQDFNESNDLTMKSASEKHSGLLDPTWLGWNTTSSWFYFQVDESLSGELLENPEDYTSPGLEPVMNVLPVFAAAVFFVILIGMMWSETLTVEMLIAWLVAFIAAVLAIVIMLNIT